MEEAVEQERPDGIFFLGDCIRDGRTLSARFPHTPAYLVKGNCDWGEGEERLILELEGVRFLLTHGHLHGVKQGLLRLALAGREAGADIVCFGHTHQALNTAEPGIWLFNPGTAGGAYGQQATYGILWVEHGAVDSVEIKNIGTGH